MTPFLAIIVSDYKWDAIRGVWWDQESTKWSIMTWLQGDGILFDEYGNYL